MQAQTLALRAFALQDVKLRAKTKAGQGDKGDQKRW